MKINLPKDIPFVALVRFAAENGLDIQYDSTDELTMVKAKTANNVAPLRRRDDKTVIRRLPTFDGPPKGAA